MNPECQVLVCGLGDSGCAAAEALLDAGVRVTAVDRDAGAALAARTRRLADAGARVVLGAGPLPDGRFDRCVVSPGLAWDSPWLADLRARGVPLQSELEYGWTLRRSRTVAVTGSNGKSTAVKWLAETLAAGGHTALACGNYGRPMTAAARTEPPPEWLVAEVSSFQLETVTAFRPEVGVLLNVLPNHLDRHHDMAAYTALKARLFAQAGPDDVAIVPQALAADIRRLAGGRGRWLTFGGEDGADYVFRGGRVLREGKPAADLSGTVFDHPVLGVNAAAVVAAVEACGLPGACAAAAARGFQTLPHRLQQLPSRRGVHFVNDSKATNLAALAAALRVLPGGVRLIAGGLSKETDFTPVLGLLRERARGVYLVGRAAEAMGAAWDRHVPCRLCKTLDVAVRQAWQDAQPGETILLSPACASYDQFRNYAERGECFINSVENIERENT